MPEPSPVNLVDESGRVVNTDTDTASELLRQGGYRLATDTEVSKDLERQEFSDVGSQLAAGVEGAAAELTLGGTDVLGQSGLFGQQYAEEARKRAEYSSTARTVGRVAGGVGAALLTGGESIVARGLARTPAGMVMRASLAAEEAANATRLGRVGGLMASGVVEGALFGAGEGVSEAALSPDDADRTAEGIFASAVERGFEGMLLGGGTGLGLGVASKTAEKAAGAIGRRARAFRESLEAGAKGKASAGKKTAQQMVDEQRITLRLEDGQGLPDPRTRMQQMQDSLSARRNLDSQIKEDAVRFADAEDVAAQATDYMLDDEATGAIKASSIQKAFDRSPPEVPEGIVGAAEELLSPMRRELEDMLATHSDVLSGVRGGSSDVKKAIKSIDGAIERMRGAEALDVAAASKNAGEIFMQMDNLKRSVGRVAKKNDRFLSPKFADFYERTRAFLEDESVWGKAVTSEIQSPVNRPFSEYLTTSKPFQSLTHRGDFDARIGSKFGFGTTKRAEPAKIETLLRGLADPTQRNNREIVVSTIRSRKQLAEAMEKAYGVDSARVKAIRDATDEMEKILARSERVSLDARKADELLQDLSAVPGLGGAVQLTASMASRASKLQGLYEAAGRGQASLSSKMSDLVRGVKGAARGAAKRARVAGIAASIATRGSSNTKERRERYMESAKRLREFEDDPQGATRRVIARAGAGSGAPLISQSIASTAARGAKYLLDTMPRARKRTLDPLDELDPTRISDTELSRWLDRVDAVENPLGVVDDIASGRVPRHKIETIKAVYPRLFADMQQAALDEISSLEKPPDYDTRKAVGLILDMPVDETLTPAFVASMQRALQMARQQPQAEPPITPGNAKAPSEMDDMHATRVEKIAGLM